MILETLADSGYISSLDLYLAKELLGDDSLNLNCAAALICHLSLSARRGHLCIEIDGDKVWPDPRSAWNENRYSEEGSLQKEDASEYLDQVTDMIARGIEQLPLKLLTVLRNDVDEIDALQTPLCRMGNRIYFQRYWFYETFFLFHYRRFISNQPRIGFDKSKIFEQVKSLENSKKLLPDQAKAILNACDHTFTMICGGPGTGKTYTAGTLICTLWNALEKNQQEKFEIALAAPTGKAAANLQKSLLRATEGIGQLSNLQSKTLHALLGMKGTSITTDPELLPFDLVIVDESSMIDVRLMAALFAAMKPGSRLILLGDSHQLPAVEAGSLFADFVNEEGEISRVSKLHQCLRSELQGILDVAAAINQGNAEEVIQLFGSGASGIERLIIEPDLKTNSAIAKELCHYACERFRMENLEGLEPKDLLNHFNSFRLLSPMRKGVFGVEEINYLINRKIKSASVVGNRNQFIAPIMLLKNDYRLELFNGEVGVLVKSIVYGTQGDFDFRCGDYALFISKDGGIKKVAALMLPPFEYAYCLSVHKSQGSEFDHLLLLLPLGSESFGRELFYTAVTRARRQLTLWGDDITIKATVERKTQRLSGISGRLK